MRDVGDEIAASFFDALGFGEVAEHGDGAAIGQGRGGDVEGAAGNDGSGACGLHLLGGSGGFDGGEEIGIANGFDDGRVEARVLGNEAIHGLVGPLHEAIGTDGDDGVLHAVEQSFELALAGTDGGEAAFDLAGGFVDGGGDAANFIEGTVVDAGAQVALLDAGGDVDDAIQTAGVQTEAEAAMSKARKRAMVDPQSRRRLHLRLHGFDVGKRIGEADRATGHGNGDVEKWNAERGAAALVLAGLPARAAANSLRVAWFSMLAGLDSESARTFPEASMMVARAPAARPSCAAISGREWVRSVSTRWAKSRVFCVRLRSISVRSEASQAPPSMTSRMAAVAAMTIRKTARSLKKMRFFTSLLVAGGVEIANHERARRFTK